MKVKFGMMMTDGRGKLGGQVASKNRAGSYVRTKVTPVNPQTTYQQNVRANFGNVSQYWSGLTAEQVDAWNAAVGEWQSTDIFGDLRTPSGKNLFQKINNYLAELQLAYLDNPPLKQVVPQISNLAATAAISPDAITATLDAAENLSDYDAYLLVSATPPVNAGVSFVKNKYRRIGIFEPTIGANSLDLTAGYIAKFGSIAGAPGKKVYIRVQSILSNGQVGVPLDVVANFS